ncbi:MAG: hypothetical protein D4R72_01655 [Nitrosopumilales archaeon]|nr:MAG: hypothetical protein D4R72_01655 [Nitrosopumilales archaeon]
MYNNTLRKITSLSLLTILLTSTAAFAMPNALPQAHASTNANLFVSAENSQFNNYFAGPQVIQVIVSDPDIQRLDQVYGEPVVTVDGKRLRMTQGTDGNWYAYLADRAQAIAAANTAQVSGKGLNFGGFCSSTSTTTPKAGVNYADTKGFTIARGGFGSTNHTNGTITTDFPKCTSLPGQNIAASNQQMEHVVRQNKTINMLTTGFGSGAITNIYPVIWPVIQLYDFGGSDVGTVKSVPIDYSKAGGDQIVTLTFSRIPANLISSSVDRTAYPANSQVFVTVNDPQLNVDPTEEDSWTWGANATNSTLYYEAFTRNGAADADGTTGMQNLIGNLTALMFNHNGKFTLNPAASGVNVVNFQDNGKQVLTSTDGTGAGQTNAVRTKSIGLNSAPVTFIESGGVNTGVFASWDGGKVSDLITSNTLTIRGQSASIRYNDVSASIVGNFGYGTISTTTTNGTWASGQKIPLTLVDTDANLNSKISEHRDLFKTTNYQTTTGGVPAMTIGTPFALSTGVNATFVNGTHSATSVAAGIRTIQWGLTGDTPARTEGNTTSTAAMADTTGIEHILLITPLTATSSGIKSGNPGSSGTAASAGLGPHIINGTNMALILDSNKTMTTLKNTIHSTLKNDTENFRGFNFINYDLRSLLTNSTGSVSKVNIYLIYNPTGSHMILDQHTQLPVAGLKVISLANSTNLQDFINLNGTVALGGTHGSKTTPGVVDNGTLTAFNLFHQVPSSATVGFMFNLTTNRNIVDNQVKPVVADFFSVGIKGDGITNDQRVNNAIYRWELQETGDNTSTFTGTTEYVMLNQLNIFDPNTYTALRPINVQVKFVAIQDMLQAESRAPQTSYEDLGADGQFSIISTQTDIPTHTGVVSFDSKTYKTADTVTITLRDADLNVDNDLVDIYTVVPAQAGVTSLSNEDPAADTVGKTGLGFYSDHSATVTGTSFGRLLDIQFGQTNARWANTGCFGAGTTTALGFNLGLADTGFSLVETGPSTGIFTGNFEVPDQVCDNSSPTATSVSTTISSIGLNLKVNYVDFRDESGKKIEISDNAGVRGNTGSITLDKSVYPVPFGSLQAAATPLSDFNSVATSVTSKNGVFPLHRDNTGSGLTSVNTLANGDTLVHIRVNDADFNTNPIGTDHLNSGIARGTDTSHGPVWAVISRQSSNLLLAFAGGPNVITTHAVIKTAPASPTAPSAADASNAIDLGPMTEIDPSSGIFQADLPIRFTDGPAKNDCPVPTNYKAANGTYSGTAQTDRFDFAAASGTNYCVRQGDVLTVYYNDTNDASGHQQIVTDSATFDLRNGVLQSDKSVYIIGSDMILTLVEPDLNLDSQQSEAASLDLVEWDSHAFKGTMGPLGLNQANFDAKPSTFVETGKDTGIFQSVIKIPKQLSTTGAATGTLLERGEQIHLEYTDWGPAGSKTIGANNQDIQLTIYTSNFGATVELDQKVYTWTDRVYITVVAPDHNFDPNLIDTIGSTDLNKVTVSTRGNSINQYKLVESGVDTGIFTGYVILTGSSTLKDSGGVDGAGTQPTAAGPTSSGHGPTDGFLPSEDNDGVSVSFEFTRDQTVTGSALIRWNIGETKWLEASYPANGQGVLQIVDPDMNLNPKAIDKFDTNVWSDSDSGGIKLTMTETGQATGIFQGTVYFTTNFQSSGNRLHVAEGDTVTGEYKDRTLPAPYTPADQLRLTSTTFIGTVVPPLERAPASNPRIVDSFGNALTSVKVNQQIQVTADLTNGQDRDQPFAYLVQIQDGNGVTVSLSWITGTLTGGQSLNPAQSWTPTASGTYTAQIFVWQSIDNPNALSQPLSTTITVA